MFLLFIKFISNLFFRIFYKHIEVARNVDT